MIYVRTAKLPAPCQETRRLKLIDLKKKIQTPLHIAVQMNDTSWVNNLMVTVHSLQVLATGATTENMTSNLRTLIESTLKSGSDSYRKWYHAEEGSWEEDVEKQNMKTQTQNLWVFKYAIANLETILGLLICDGYLEPMAQGKNSLFFYFKPCKQ